MSFDPLAPIESAAAKILIGDLTEIQSAVNIINANPGNNVVIQEQIAAIVGVFEKAKFQAPVLLPLAEATLIQAIASNLTSLIGNVIGKLEPIASTPAPAVSPASAQALKKAE